MMDFGDRTRRLIRGRRAQAAGLDAEAITAAALTREGWAVLSRRARTPAGEIDLVAERDGLLAFIEVKARPSLSEAALALGARQRTRLLAAAECWLAANPGHGAAGVRFDVVIVAADGTARRIADAFRVGD
ncbi:YraN family protein [Neoroseomonas rubea]|uniref:YraN family protein n=1 Tax=Neoroseomonas rubea TaxID=2748666 RepID=UPI001E4F49C1|nr:YraN family protein [Roseomonas rubea]